MGAEGYGARASWAAWNALCRPSGGFCWSSQAGEDRGLKHELQMASAILCCCFRGHVCEDSLAGNERLKQRV